MQPGQNIFKSPKAMVLAVAPKAKCVRDWIRGGYRIEFGQEVRDFNGKGITSLQTSTANPADAWSFAVFELRLDRFNKPREADSLKTRAELLLSIAGNEFDSLHSEAA